MKRPRPLTVHQQCRRLKDQLLLAIDGEPLDSPRLQQLWEQWREVERTLKQVDRLRRQLHGRRRR